MIMANTLFFSVTDSSLKWFTEFGHLNRASQNNTGVPMKKRNFSAEFKRKSAQLILEQNYTVALQLKISFLFIHSMRLPHINIEA